MAFSLSFVCETCLVVLEEIQEDNRELPTVGEVAYRSCGNRPNGEILVKVETKTA